MVIFYYITSTFFSDGELTKKKPKLDLSFTDSAFISSEHDEAILDGFKIKLYWIPKTYTCAEYCKATSLPLHFYFGYQILQAKNLEKNIGKVSLLFH